MLDVDTVGPFLLELGLIDLDWIIDGAFATRSVSRRNRNLRIDGPAGLGFLIKEPHNPGQGGHATLRCESAFHEFCSNEPAAIALMRFLPRLVLDLVGDAILVFELISDAVTFHVKSHGQIGRGHDLTASRALGHALGTVHRVFRPMDLDRDSDLGWLPHALPSVLSLHRPLPEHLAGLSRADLELLHIVQTHGDLGEHIDRLKKSWRAETVIHGDIRFDNVLVRAPQGDGESDAVDLWIVDWEMVRIGDPAWDLAGAFQDFLILWISSMPLSDELTAEEMTARARVPLDHLRTASRALWAGYRAGACIEIAEEGGFLRRAVSFSAIRLIQSAFEYAGNADRLAGIPVLLLQIGANLLADPELGQVQLFGIPPGSVAP